MFLKLKPAARPFGHAVRSRQRPVNLQASDAAWRRGVAMGDGFPELISPISAWSQSSVFAIFPCCNAKLFILLEKEEFDRDNVLGSLGLRGATRSSYL